MATHCYRDASGDGWMSPGSELFFLIVSFSLVLLRSVVDVSWDGLMATHGCRNDSGDDWIVPGSELIFVIVSLSLEMIGQCWRGVLVMVA